MPQFDFTSSLPYPVGAVPISNSSGSVAAASAVATLAAATGKTTWITGIKIAGLGATASSLVTIAVSGLLGGTTNFFVAVPVGATVPLGPVNIDFHFPLPGSAVNTAVVVTMGTLGAGNTAAAVTATGYQV